MSFDHSEGVEYALFVNLFEINNVHKLKCCYKSVIKIKKIEIENKNFKTIIKFYRKFPHV